MKTFKKETLYRPKDEWAKKMEAWHNTLLSAKEVLTGQTQKS